MGGLTASSHVNKKKKKEKKKNQNHGEMFYWEI